MGPPLCRTYVAFLFSPNVVLVLPDLQRRVVKLGWCFWDNFK